MGNFERLRRFVPGRDDTDRPYECRTCGQRFARQRQVCPDCDGFRIERTEW